jgi:hypothetical protein
MPVNIIVKQSGKRGYQHDFGQILSESNSDIFSSPFFSAENKTRRGAFP